MAQKLTTITLDVSPAIAKKLEANAASYDESPGEYIKRILQNKKPKFNGDPLVFLDNPNLIPDKAKTLDFRKNANDQCQCSNNKGQRCSSNGVLKPVHTTMYIYMACAKHISEANKGGIIRPHSSSDPSLGGAGGWF